MTKAEHKLTKSENENQKYKR